MLEITFVDAFAEAPFAGNPAAVCVLDHAVDASWMQRLAEEINLSETAFVVPRGDGDFDLRWFTPAVEVPLCGHATLASAHVLWERGVAGPGTVLRFHTRTRGSLEAAQDVDGRIRLDFPADHPTDVDDDAAARVAAAVGVSAVWIGHSPSNQNYLVRVADAAVVRGLEPDMAAVSELGPVGVIVTAPADAATPDHDFVSRYFAPSAGVPEDPVTGSAHCLLAPYWSAELGRTDLAGYQASPRGGTVWTRLRDDRVHLLGQAVTTMRAELLAGVPTGVS
jgi:PhzF family phenazine biosynthesis protein